MNKAEISEIKKRFTLKDCSITGCAVASFATDEKIQSSCTSERFLTLDEQTQKRLFAILKKCYNTAPDDFAEDVSIDGDLKRAFSSIAQSSTIDENIASSIMQQIKEHYDVCGRFAILYFTDTYDIPIRDASNSKTGESDETFQYTAICICPIKASKSGLVLNHGQIDEATINHMIGAPVASILYPSYTGRTSNEDKAFICAKKDPERSLFSRLFSIDIPDSIVSELVPQEYAEPNLISSNNENITCTIDQPTCFDTDAEFPVSGFSPSEAAMSSQQNYNKLESAISQPDTLIHEPIQEKVLNVSSLGKKLSTYKINGDDYYIIPKDTISLDRLQEFLISSHSY